MANRGRRGVQALFAANASSTISHTMWPAARWTCWINGVFSLGTRTRKSQSSAIAWPFFPVKPMVVMPRDRAAVNAARMFGERPEVESPRNTSPAWPSASTCRANKCSNPRIVADRGRHGGIGPQSQSGQGSAIEIEAHHQLGGEVLRVRRAAAVAREQDFLPGAERIVTTSAVRDTASTTRDLRAPRREHRARLRGTSSRGPRENWSSIHASPAFQHQVRVGALSPVLCAGAEAT